MLTRGQVNDLANERMGKRRRRQTTSWAAQAVTSPCRGTRRRSDLAGAPAGAYLRSLPLSCFSDVDQGRFRARLRASARDRRYADDQVSSEALRHRGPDQETPCRHRGGSPVKSQPISTRWREVVGCAHGGARRSQRQSLPNTLSRKRFLEPGLVGQPPRSA